MNYDERSWGAGQWLAVSGISVLLLGLLIALVLWVAGSLRSGQQLRGSDHRHNPRALDLLAERYARGDIDEQDYLRRREQLQDAVDPAPSSR